MTFYYMDYDMSNGMSFYEYFPCIRREGNWFLQGCTIAVRMRLREQSLRMLQTGVEEILLGYETTF